MPQTVYQQHMTHIVVQRITWEINIPNVKQISLFYLWKQTCQQWNVKNPTDVSSLFKWKYT